ncbi:MAG TPA: GH3 auxin-responsive promoter family protein, partial [Opitutaceae bacterium]|nr:GH3 auxin-responsive promoter family protein [Opitutaceae bacterium]
ELGPRQKNDCGASVRAMSSVQKVAMPRLPHSLIALGASLYAPLRARRWKAPRRAIHDQEKTLAAWLPRAAATAYGKACGIRAGMTYAQFQTRIPPSTYETIRPWIERMMQGEANILWPGQCADYVTSAGTTYGHGKHLPATADICAHFRQATLDALIMYTARTGSTRVFQGRHLALGGATPPAPLQTSPTFPIRSGNLASLIARNLTTWAECPQCGEAHADEQLVEWQERVQSIAQSCSAKNITLLAGVPAWLVLLAEELRHHAYGQGRPLNQLRDLWPNLECLVHSGMPVAPFAEELRQNLGSGVNFHEIYAACEGLIAAQDASGPRGLRLMAHSGLFFEFIPMSVFDEHRVEHLGDKAVPLAGVKPGVDYALLLTTPAGLCRYVLGDVVRFVTTEPPRLTYVGRTRHQLNAFGEHVTEKDITESLTAVCARHNWSTVNFHVAPLAISSTTGRTTGHHEWWIELKPGTHETPTGPLLEGELDAELQRLHEGYRLKRKNSDMRPPVVRLVMPGLFAQWLTANGKWGGQHKMPRCRSDRAIADVFASLAQFNK